MSAGRERSSRSTRGRSWFLPAAVPLVLLVLVLLGGSSFQGPSPPRATTLPRSAAAAGPTEHPPSAAPLFPAPPPSPVAKGTTEGRALASSLSSVASYVGSIPRRPSPGPPLPNLTGNISGFTISALAASLTGNTGLWYRGNISNLPSGAGTSTFVFSLVGETVSNVTAFVGYVEGTFYGINGAIPLYLVLNGTTLQTCGIGAIPGQIMFPGPQVHQFTMEEDHGDWWNFLADGALIAGGGGGAGGFCSGAGNGTADLWSASTSFLVTPLYAWLLSANVTGVHGFTVQTVCEYRRTGGSSWAQAQVGTMLLDTVLGAAGYDQDPTIPPDTVNAGPGYAILGPLTPMWGAIAPYPALALRATGLNSSTVAGASVPFTVWVNASGTQNGVGTATLWANSLLEGGAAFVPKGTGPSPGEFHLLYVAPQGFDHANDTITLMTNNTAYVSARQSFTMQIDPAPVAISAKVPSGPLPSGMRETVTFEVSTAAGPLSNSSATITPSLSGGGTISRGSGWGIEPGVFAVALTAPMYLIPSLSVVTLSVSGPGIISASSSVTVRVEPRPLVLAGPSPGAPWAGSLASYALSLSTPVGTLPAPGQSWWNYSIAGTSNVRVTGGSVALASFGGNATLQVPYDPGYLGPAFFWVNVTASGFNATGTWWWENVTGNLTLQLANLPGTVNGGVGETVTLRVLGLGGAALPGVTVNWAASFGGGFAPGWQSTATEYTDANGVASIIFLPPHVANSTRVAVDVSVAVPYYAPAAARTTSTDLGPAPAGTLQNAQAFAFGDLLLLLILLALLLALYAEARSRHERAGRPTASPFSRPAPGPWAVLPMDDEDAGGEGRAPWPGPSEARYEEEEIGSSDRPPEGPRTTGAALGVRKEPPVKSPAKRAVKETEGGEEEEPAHTATDRASNDAGRGGAESGGAAAAGPSADAGEEEDAPKEPLQGSPKTSSAMSSSGSAPSGAPSPPVGDDLRDEPPRGQVERSAGPEPSRGSFSEDARARREDDDRPAASDGRTSEPSGPELVEEAPVRKERVRPQQKKRPRPQ